MTIEKPKRTLIGKICKYSFIGFNLLMLYAVVTGIDFAAEEMTNSEGAAEEIGTAVGAGIGAMMLIIIWVTGDIILGIFTFLTRAK